MEKVHGCDKSIKLFLFYFCAPFLAGEQRNQFIKYLWWVLHEVLDLTLLHILLITELQNISCFAVLMV